MAPTDGRSRPFSFTQLRSNGKKPRNIPVNSFHPIDISTDRFVGTCMLIHDTGGEPVFDDDETHDADDPETKRRGLELQFQGRFTEKMPSDIWIGAELAVPLNLGWLARQSAKIVLALMKKLMSGQVYHSFGDDRELPHLCFPFPKVFTTICTPPGQTPPVLGSPEVSRAKYQADIRHYDYRPECTYTWKYNTVYADWCRWELLGIPGFSPYPMENLLGNNNTRINMFLYDLQTCPGKDHSRCKDNVLFEICLRRGNEGDFWLDGDEDDSISQRSEGVLSAVSGALTPLNDDSDQSEISSEDDDIEHREDSDHSSEEGEPLEEPLEDEVSARSQATSEVSERWKPPTHKEISPGAHVNVPFYIEAVDRRWRRRTRVWYVFEVVDAQNVDTPRQKNTDASPKSESWWCAKALSEIRTLWRPRPRLKTFRRGAARGCFTIPALEVARQATRSMLKSGSKLIQRLTTDGDQDEVPGKTGTPSHGSRLGVRREKKPAVPVVPPRFFEMSVACGLAFAKAAEGRDFTLREGVVGAVHFEGRLCEELLRLSKEPKGFFLRTFTPYDGDRGARIRVNCANIHKVERNENLFLGRFATFEVHTLLKTFVFCCPDAKERDHWLSELQDILDSPNNSASSNVHVPIDLSTSFASTPPKVRRPRSRSDGSRENQLDAMAYLTDTTKSRRWRPKNRLVLNDRQLLLTAESQKPAPPDLAGSLLKAVLKIRDDPLPVHIIEFTNDANLLKTVCLSSCGSDQLLAFWLNVYHCLLIHGLLVLGSPKTAREILRFQRRVSYLVGCTPISLLEIQRNVLRAYARAQHETDHGEVTDEDLDEDFYSKRSNTKSGGFFSCFCFRSSECAPGPPRLRFGGKFRAIRAQKCLFLNVDQEDVSYPQPDLRVVFVLNSGNVSCLEAIPVFLAKTIQGQLDHASRIFLLQFVEVQRHSGRVKCVTLPFCCRALKRSFRNDPHRRNLLKWVARYMSAADQQAITGEDKPINVTVRFAKYRRQPRHRLSFYEMPFPDEVLRMPISPASQANGTPTGTEEGGFFSGTDDDFGVGTEDDEALRLTGSGFGDTTAGGARKSPDYERQTAEKRKRESVDSAALHETAAMLIAASTYDNQKKVYSL